MALSTSASAEIYFRLENKTDSEIIVTIRFFNDDSYIKFLLKDGSYIGNRVWKNPYTDESILPEGEIQFMDMRKFWNITLPPLEIFNTVVSSLCVTDTNGTVLLTEKDLTNDSFIRYDNVNVAFTIEVTEEEKESLVGSNIKSVNSLIGEGIDIEAKDADGNTVLLCASRDGHTEAVKALIEAGADIEAKDNDGRTALMVAATYFEGEDTG